MVAVQERKQSRLAIVAFAAVIVGLLAVAALVGIVALSSTSQPAAAAPATIIAWEPGLTRGVPLSGPISVYFNRTMDHASVEKAWSLSPAVPGTFRWSATSVTFRPSAPLASESQYRLHIGRAALDDHARHLTRPFSVAFTTGDTLGETGETPAAGSTEVPTNNLIAVTFNHPMVALAGLGSPVRNPSGWHVAISPTTLGFGRWVGNSTWVFHPRNGLAPSSRYNVTVSASAHDAWGEPLGSDLTWSFTTVRPSVIAESPRSGSHTADPSAPVTVTFNQRMDVGSTVQAFRLRSGPASVAGSTSWDGNTLQFQPAMALDPNRTYTATVRRSALSASGDAALETSLSWTFRVAPPPRVVSSTPSSGATAAGSYVELHFSAPMDRSSLDSVLTTSPMVPDMSTFMSGSVYSISGDFQPSTSYTVSIAPGAEDTHGRAMPRGFTLRFTTAPIPPSATLYGPAGPGSGLSVTAGRVAQAPIQLINVPSIRYTLVRTSLSRVTSDSQYGVRLAVPNGDTIRSWTASVPHPLNRVQDLRVPLAAPDGSPLPPGLYWLGAQGPAVGRNVPSSSELVAVTDAGVTMKIAQHRVLVWVTSARTGRPLAGETVHLVDNSGHSLAVAVTDARGLHLFSLSRPYDVRAVTATGSAFGMAMADWQPDTGSAANLPVAAPQYKGGAGGRYVYTDRPIYRPGQTVHFRAVLWADHDGVYGSLGRAKATVTATDAAGHTIYHRSLALDRFGTLHGDFTLPQSASTGDGGISVTLPHSAPGAYTGFAVAAYRKPQFLTSVSAGKRRYAQGQTIDATVQVKYIFGAPAAGQTVDWTAYSQGRLMALPGWERYEFGDPGLFQQWDTRQPFGTPGEGVFGTEIAHGSGTTDGAGRLALHVPVDLAGDPSDQTITIEATSTDVDHQPVSGRVQVVALKSLEQIGLASRRQVVPAGKAAVVDAVALTARGKVVRYSALTATVYRRTYTSRFGTSGGNGQLWQQVPHDLQVSTQSLTTGSKGRTSFSFTPRQGGEYYVVVTGTDRLGNAARSGIFIYASAAGFSDWGSSTNTFMALQPNHATYRIGQTAKILVATPFAGAAALVTVERSGIRSYRIEHLTSSSPMVRVPIVPGDIPDVYVTVTLYHGEHGSRPPAWRYGVTDLHVSVAPRTLVIHLAQNRARYQPGQTAIYSVTTTDTSGHPVSAQVSLALVDTAVLALHDQLGPDILSAFYGQRPLGVQTMSDGAVSIDSLREHARGKIVPQGLGGGGGGGPGPPPIYRRFRDTGYWRADVTTDRSGHATVRVKLPDNFTIWRLDARGVTTGHRVGQATLRTVSRRDVVIRPVVPRFFVQGDSLTVGALVNDNAAHPARVDVSLHAVGLTVPAVSHAATVRARREQLLTWKVSVPESNRATLTFSAAPDSGRGYSVRISVPVHPPLTGEVVAASGQVYGSARQAVILPSNAVSRPGDLSIGLSSSVVAGLGRAYSTFAPSRYESNDDVAARLLAAAALRGAPQTVAGGARPFRGHLSGDTARAARTLLARQRADGGWSWFSGGTAPSDPLVSADAVLALATSGHAASLARARVYLASQLSHLSPDDRAFLLLAIARSGRPDRRDAEMLAHDSVATAHLSTPATADLSAALAAAGDRAGARSLVAGLDGDAVVSATGANWDVAGLGGTTSTAATAQVLSALLAVAPGDAYIPAAARWLMLARDGSGWNTTRDSALAVAALSTYARNAREGHSSYRYRLAVDGVTRLRGSATPRAAMSRRLDIPVAALHRGGSAFTVSRTLPGGSVGGGPLYYLAQLHYFLPAGSMAPLDQGVSVKRQYLDFSGHSVRAVAAGSVVEVKLTLRTGRTLTHLAVNDPIPSGFEPIDRSLQTTRQDLFSAWQPELAAPGVRHLSSFLNHTDLRDDRVSLYASSLPPGTYRFSYLAQATVPGTYAVAPARASEEFLPEVFGRSAGETITVR